uniref:Uncharacterized protein n=1 Tax=Oncorhynchus kisutch TaxID=8019 RepID=A0A8C7LSJ7_ONCKI
MEWREQSSISCDAAFLEAQIWVEVRRTTKIFNWSNQSFFWILLCDLINRIKPGIIKRVNRLSTPIAGLVIFLRLIEAQLFRSGDLQDTSTRVNVLITIYWLGRKAQCEPFYNGPNLRLKAFEGLLDIAALSKVNK